MTINKQLVSIMKFSLFYILRRIRTEDVPTTTDEECADWLRQFYKHKVSVLVNFSRVVSICSQVTVDFTVIVLTGPGSVQKMLITSWLVLGKEDHALK